LGNCACLVRRSPVASAASCCASPPSVPSSVRPSVRRARGHLTLFCSEGRSCSCRALCVRVAGLEAPGHARSASHARSRARATLSFRAATDERISVAVSVCASEEGERARSGPLCALSFAQTATTHAPRKLSRSTYIIKQLKTLSGRLARLSSVGVRRLAGGWCLLKVVSAKRKPGE